MRADLTFHDTAARAARLTFPTQPWDTRFLNPRVVVSGDGRWLVIDRALWDLGPTLASLDAGGEPAPPVRVSDEPAPGTRLLPVLGFDPAGRRAVQADWGRPHHEIIDLTGFRVV